MDAPHTQTAKAPLPHASVFFRGSTADIDIVYTWVDGSSAEFQAQVQHFAALYRARHELDEHAFLPSRFADNDCLRYSMRSISMFAPWIRNIVIVTNGQKPDWLDIRHPQIRLVSHHEIFPDPSVLPTFNSFAIEASLHRIPSLSENFLYFNDDFLLGRQSERNDFFSKSGKIRVRYQEGLANRNIAHEVRQQRAVAYCVSLLDQRFGAKRHRHHFPHCPVMLSKSVLGRMEAEWQWDFDRTRTHRFRNERDCIVSLLHPHYLAEHYETLFGDGEDENEIEYMKGQGAAFVALGRPGFDLAATLQSTLDERPRYICINDEFGVEGSVDSASERDIRARLADFLSSYFPQKAAWEV